jgi:hypothetical protein
MEYLTVYDFGIETIEIGWTLLFFSILILGYGSAWSNYRQKQPRKKALGEELIIGTIGLILCLLSLSGSISNYFHTKTVYHYQHYHVIEGIIENFEPMPYGGHPPYEYFTVNGIQFSYGDFDERYHGFNNTASHGGPIQQGLPVRISYYILEQSPIILKIEISKDAIPKSEYYLVNMIQQRKMLRAQLPFIGGIFGLMLIVPGLLTGMYCAYQNIFGGSADLSISISSHAFSNNQVSELNRISYQWLLAKIPQLGILPDGILTGGLGSIMGGLLGLSLVYYGNVTSNAYIYGIIAGGLFGITYVGYERLFGSFRASKIPIYGHVVVWGIIAFLVSGTANEVLEMFIEFVGGLLNILRIQDLFIHLYLNGIIGVIAGGLAGILSAGLYAVRYKENGKIRRSFFGGLIGISAGVLSIGFYSKVSTLHSLTVGFGGAIIWGAIGIIFPYIAKILSSLLAFVLIPLISLLRFKIVICPGCLRYTYPMKSAYEHGKRFCEHCQKEVERTTTFQKLIFQFGTVSLKPNKDNLVLANPGVQLMNFYVDVGEIQIDMQTYNPRKLEQFIIYITNYPPKHGLKSIRVFYHGNLDEIEPNLRNVLQNTFKHIKPM